MSRHTKDSTVAADPSAGIIASLMKKLNSVSKTEAAFDPKHQMDIDFISTGCWILDRAISNRPDKGGFPQNRIIDVSGEYSTGKSLITGTLIRECQKAGGVGVVIDTEMSFNAIFLEKTLGVDLSKVIPIQENVTENIFEHIDILIAQSKESDMPFTIVIDSMAGMASKKMFNLDYSDDYNAINMYEAKKLGNLLKKANANINGSKVTIVCVGQARDNIASGPMASFAPRKRSTAGNQLKHYTSVALWLKKIQNIKDNKKNIVGVWIEAAVNKSNIAPPFKKVWMPIFFDRGIDNCLAELKYIENRELMKKSGQNIKMVCADGEVLETTTKQWVRFYNENQDKIRNIILQNLLTSSENMETDEAIADEDDVITSSNKEE